MNIGQEKLNLGKDRFHTTRERKQHQLKEKNFNSKLALTKLWMSNSHLVALRDEGHVVGLHSFSHPTMLHEMSAGGQEYEYKSNMVHLREILGDDPISMSHPCGRYNDDTLRILFKLEYRFLKGNPGLGTESPYKGIFFQI